MKNKSFIGYLIRYSIATIGLALVAVGVALSIKSQLGTAPISCPPYVLSLIPGTAFSLGEYTIMMHLCFISLQVLLLRKQFKLEYLMQLVPTFLFGYMCDLSIWIFNGISVSTLGGKIGFLVLSCIITAMGISIEVMAKAWMLAGEMTTQAFAIVTKSSFSNVKIIFDIVCVLVTALLSWFLFHNIFGADPNTDIAYNLLAESDKVVIGAGTLISAIFTGLIMKGTDPLCELIFGKAIRCSYGFGKSR